MSPPPSTFTLALGVTLALALVGGCVAQDPNVVVPPDNPPPAGSIFADVVLGITAGSMTQSCVENGGVPLCGETPTAQPGPCANNPALGPVDNKAFTIQPLGRIELGFLCSTIIEVGLNPTTMMASTDFVVHGTIGAGAMPIVEVSLDGTHYVAVNYWPKANNAYVTDAGFGLEVPMWASARFVRISETSGLGTIQIDALEALRRVQ